MTTASDTNDDAPLRYGDLVLTALIALAARVVCDIAYTPWWVGDSAGYSGWWVVVSRHAWQFYDGLRPPLYPLFLALVELLSGSEPTIRLTYRACELAVYLQQAGGVAATVIFYLLLRNVGATRPIRLIGALFYAALAPVCMVEMVLLPLALSSQLLIVGVWLFTMSVRGSIRSPGRCLFALASGLVFSLGALTRAEVLIFVLTFLCSVSAIAMFSNRYHPGFMALRRASWIAAASAVPLLLALICLHKVMLGHFTFTTGAALNATSTVYNLFDKVEPSDRVFGEVMLKHFRGEARIDLVTDAMSELAKRRGEMPIARNGPPASDLYFYAGEVAHRLQRRYPQTYLSNAARSFGRTFDFSQGSDIPRQHVSDPESPDGKSITRSSTACGLIEWMRQIEAPFMLLLYCLTILLVPVVLAGAALKWIKLQPTQTIALSVAIGLLAVFISYGFFHTYLKHYGLVFFGCIVFSGVAIAESTVRGIANGRKGLTSL